MRLLLDTHVLLWLLNGSPRLGARARGLIDDSDNDVVISVVSIWEIAVKVRVGKLRVELNELLRVIQGGRLTRLGITDEHLAALLALPWVPDHSDPFDHLLIAQAIAEGMSFVSADRRVSAYPVPWVPGDA